MLIGHSMGGVLATLITERTAARAVIDVDGDLSRGDCTHSGLAAAYSLEDFLAHGFATMRGTSTTTAAPTGRCAATTPR